MGLLIGSGIQYLEARKRYTYTMGSLIGFSVQLVLKPQNGIPRQDKTISFLGHGIAHRIKRRLRLKA